MTEPQWYDRAGLRLYTHERIASDGIGSDDSTYYVTCLRHPETDERHVLRQGAPEAFLLSWDDGEGAATIPCPFGECADPQPLITDPFGFLKSAPVERDGLAAYLTNRDRVDPMPHNLVEDLRRAMSESLRIQYAPQPMGLVLHPRDWNELKARDEVAAVEGPDKVEMQKRVADAFGIPYWIAGVEGVKAPRRVRWRSWRRALPRRVITAIPGVHWHGPRETGEGWFNDSMPEPRMGRWFLHVGNYRIGNPMPEEES